MRSARRSMAKPPNSWKILDGEITQILNRFVLCRTAEYSNCLSFLTKIKQLAVGKITPIQREEQRLVSKIKLFVVRKLTSDQKVVWVPPGAKLYVGWGAGPPGRATAPRCTPDETPAAAGTGPLHMERGGRQNRKHLRAENQRPICKSWEPICGRGWSPENDQFKLTHFGKRNS